MSIINDRGGARSGGGWCQGGPSAPLAPPKKSINISSIILYNAINGFKNYINKWLINRMVF